jgi:hypothetical protein
LSEVPPQAFRNAQLKADKNVIRVICFTLGRLRALSLTGGSRRELNFSSVALDRSKAGGRGLF